MEVRFSPHSRPYFGSPEILPSKIGLTYMVGTSIQSDPGIPIGWLVLFSNPLLKNVSSSVGMMKFQSTNQLGFHENLVGISWRLLGTKKSRSRANSLAKVPQLIPVVRLFRSETTFFLVWQITKQLWFRALPWVLARGWWC